MPSPSVYEYIESSLTASQGNVCRRIAYERETSGSFDTAEYSGLFGSEEGESSAGRSVALLDSRLRMQRMGCTLHSRPVV